MGNREELAILETEYLISYMYEMDYEDVKRIFEDVDLPDNIRAYPRWFTYSYDKAADATKLYLDNEGIKLPEKKHSGGDYMRYDKRVRVSVFRKEYEKGIIFPETRFIIERDYSVTPLPIH